MGEVGTELAGTKACWGVLGTIKDYPGQQQIVELLALHNYSKTLTVFINAA